MENRMSVAIIFIQGVFEVVGLVGFVAGYFMDIRWLMILGGFLVVLDDIIEIGMRLLKPLFPVLLAIGLAIVFTPWYVGIFWTSAAFKIPGVPVSLQKVLTPRRFLDKAMERAGKI
jgi:hypothetical protein